MLVRFNIVLFAASTKWCGKGSAIMKTQTVTNSDQQQCNNQHIGYVIP